MLSRVFTGNRVLVLPRRFLPIVCIQTHERRGRIEFALQKKAEQ